MDAELKLHLAYSHYNVDESHEELMSIFNLSSVPKVSLPPESKTIDIREIITSYESNLSDKSEVAGHDVIALIGKTGSGKSTTIHVMLGSEIVKREKVHGVIAHRFSRAAAAFKIGETTRSETTQFSGINLADPKNLCNPSKLGYDLKEPLYLCDTPGFGDTREGYSINNSLTLIHPLKSAKSVRLLVLFSVRDMDSRATTLRVVLESIARFLPNTKDHVHGIQYAFTGLPSKGFKGDLLNQIESLLKEKDVSDDVKAILNDMKEKVKNKGSKIVINPTASFTEENTEPKLIMKKLLALKPIEPEAFLPFVEKSSQDALQNKLTALFNGVKDDLYKLEDMSLSCEEYIKASYRLFDKLEQFGFVKEFLEKYDGGVFQLM